jgi:hypothetical protein
MMHRPCTANRIFLKVGHVCAILEWAGHGKRIACWRGWEVALAVGGTNGNISRASEGGRREETIGVSTIHRKNCTYGTVLQVPSTVPANIMRYAYRNRHMVGSHPYFAIL